MNADARNSSPPRIVCFDLGGVVIRIARTWTEACAAAGLEAMATDQSETELVAETRELVHAHQTGAVDGRDFARGMSRHLGSPWRPENVLAVYDAWMLGEYAGVRDVIEQLHARSIETAALSNTNDLHWEQLHGYQAFLAIRLRLASHELGLAKPDAAIYRELERRTGVAGHDVLFFDDLEANVDAARQVGWDAVLVDHATETAPQMARALQARGVDVSPG